MDANLVVPVSGGSLMRVDMTDMMGRVLATSGVWEPHVTAALSRVLVPGDVCVDVGAHIGYHALLASTLVGPGGRVYALEPSLSAYDSLRANLALNAATNVRALRVAAGASTARAHVVEAPAGNTGEASIRTVDAARSDVCGAEREVDVEPVASVLDDADLAHLKLVKIDVEGYEAEVLSGVEPLFARGLRPFLIVEVHQPRAAVTSAAVEHLRSTYSLRAFELMRLPSRERFADVPPPRELRRPDEIEALCANGTVNVLLTPAVVA